MKLGQVQDLAGVRVDADVVLTQQTNLAAEIAEHFGLERASIRDIRANPHSGYRAVHIWLMLPAGRVEVQVRTLAQSEWANLYEDFGEAVGRGIRYGQMHEDAQVRAAVDAMHRISGTIATHEELIDLRWQVERGVEHLSSPMTPREAEVLEQSVQILEEHSSTYDRVSSQMEEMLQVFREARRIMNDEEEEV